MKRTVSFPTLFISALILFILIAVFWMVRWYLSVQEEQQQRLPVIGQVRNVTLVERSGKPVALADLRGKIWVADFIFTHCQGPCPLMSTRMRELQQRLAAFPDVQLVSISVDPERDTPAVLAEYARRYQADPGKWWFLTGRREDIYELIRADFKLTVMEATATAPITHSTRFVLVDPVGRIRGYYDSTDPAALTRLVEDINRLRKEGTRPQ